MGVPGQVLKGHRSLNSESRAESSTLPAICLVAKSLFSTQPTWCHANEPCGPLFAVGALPESERVPFLPERSRASGRGSDAFGGCTSVLHRRRLHLHCSRGVNRCWITTFPTTWTRRWPSRSSSTCTALAQLQSSNENSPRSIISPMRKVPSSSTPTVLATTTKWTTDQSGMECWLVLQNPATEGVDDVGFIETLVDVVVDLHNIDEHRIYASGWSNGCAMTQRLAMVSSDLFAAAGCMSMYLLTDPVDDYSPIPIMEVHGFLDQVVLVRIHGDERSVSIPPCGPSPRPTTPGPSRTSMSGPSTTVVRVGWRPLRQRRCTPP